MYDKELALEILTQIYQATQTVLKRFEPIRSADDFTSSIMPFYPDIHKLSGKK